MLGNRTHQTGTGTRVHSNRYSMSSHILLLCCTAVRWFDVTINLLEEVVGSGIVAVVDVGRREDVTLVAIVICDLQR